MRHIPIYWQKVVRTFIRDNLSPQRNTHFFQARPPTPQPFEIQNFAAPFLLLIFGNIASFLCTCVPVRNQQEVREENVKHV